MRAEEVLIFMGRERKELWEVYLNLNVYNYQRVCTKKKLCICIYAYIQLHLIYPICLFIYLIIKQVNIIIQVYKTEKTDDLGINWVNCEVLYLID